MMHKMYDFPVIRSNAISLHARILQMNSVATELSCAGPAGGVWDHLNG